MVKQHNKGGVSKMENNKKLMTWKDKRIHAINRLSRMKRWSTSPSNPYFEQVYRLYDSKAKNLKEFKDEEKKLNS